MAQSNQLTGDFKLLLKVPKNAIVMLLDRVFLEVTKQDSPASEASLSGLSLVDLSLVLRKAFANAEDIAKNLHEQYRYRGMKSLYLYDCTANTELETLEVDVLNRELQRMQREDSKTRTLPLRYTRICLTGLEHVDTSAGRILEFTYTYVVGVTVTDPATEYPRVVDDLRSGFLWYNHCEKWLAICSVDETILSRLKALLELAFDCTTRRIVIPKTVVDQVEAIEHVRRTTHLDPKTKTVRRYTNAEMQKDPGALREIAHRDATDERPASGYNVEVDKDTTLALGYQNRSGKIFFSKDLTVTQLYQWATSRINDLMAAVRGHFASHRSEHFETLATTVLIHRKIELRPVIAEIAAAFETCKRAQKYEITLHTDAFRVADIFASNVSQYIRVQCTECEGPAEIQCLNCSSTEFSLAEQSIKCQSCFAKIDIGNIRCSEDHNCAVEHESELIYCTLKSTIINDIKQLLKNAASVEWADGESVSIQGHTLYYCPADRSVLIALEDMPELAALLVDIPTEQEASDILKLLLLFQEKYECQSIDKCAKCVKNRYHDKCFLRLFGLFDPDFTPHPHHGHEYGDYSKRVIFEGKPKRSLVVAMKSPHKKHNQQVTRRHEIGRDIVSQVTQYFHEPSINIIGISIPQQLDDRLINELALEAAAFDKKLVVLGQEELVRIAFNAAKRHDLQITDL